MRIKHHLIIFCLGILLFCSCAPMMKFFNNITRPKIYASFTEVEPVLLKQKQLKKMSENNCTILYSYNSWIERKPLFFFSNGKPILRNSCGNAKLEETISSDIEYPDSLYLNYVIKDLVTKDNLPFTKTFHDFDYIVLMPKTTYMASLEAKRLRKIPSSFPKNSKIYYIFLNTDYYYWQIPGSKAGQKAKFLYPGNKEFLIVF